MASTTSSSRKDYRSRALGIIGIAVIAAIASYFYFRTDAASEKRIALVLAALRTPDEALPSIDRALESNPDDPELLSAKARMMLLNGSAALELEPVSERWCKAQPGDAAPFRFRMFVMHSLNRKEEEIQNAERVIALAPNDQKTRTALASLYLSVSRFEEASHQFRTLRNSTQSPLAEHLVGQARAETGRKDLVGAARLLEDLLAREPSHSEALVWRGIVHFEAGEYGQAAVKFRRARPQSSEERIFLLNHLGQALARDGKDEEAKQTFSELTRVQNAMLLAIEAQHKRDDVGYQIRAGKALLEAGQPADAVEVLEGALKRFGPRRDALLILADCYHQLGQAELATSTRTRASQLP